MLVAVVSGDCGSAMSELRDSQATGAFPAFGMLLLLPARTLQEPSWHTLVGIYCIFSSKTQIKASRKKTVTHSVT